MKSFVSLLVLLTTMFVLSGCTQPVPPGYVGKIVGIEGVQPELHQPGRVHIGPFSRDRLVLIETASDLRPAPVTVTMADPVVNESGEVENRIGLKMDFRVNVRYRLRPDDHIVTAMLQDMKLPDNVKSIEVTEVYRKYGNMVVGRVSREVLGQYTPEQVLSHLDEINETLDARMKEEMRNTPLQISSVSLGPITLPKTITDQIDLNKKTELSETQKRTEQQLALLDKQNEIELARQQAVREEVDARSLAQQNRILDESVTPEVLRLRELEVRKAEIAMMEKTLSTGNNNTVFIPYGALDSAGAQMRMFQR